MSKYATVENAEAIRDAVDRAFKGLHAAEKELADALLLASDDYEHNADQLQAIGGALKLVTSAVSVEWSKWAGYASARRLR